ncbi:DNA cytosine methyltransferase [Marilutibacter alkalisoli]|uniref:DNA (cytosine-5-)-methyltransferase n=1 Tax=Marilutibacter alkalisoli TaxID=2591633 RepID=A0A514BNJ4_9GAMM|nr:DNA cytosine methyltransferase [Lysobacter alkalisoli]QDH68952.1 DNA cytosine methyltransferase [Lysobacter alkalisoli]
MKKKDSADHPQRGNVRTHSSPVNDIVCVDLFCGAGGLTRGLIDAGIRVVAGVDLDDACKHPYETNNGSAFHAIDVANLTSSDLSSWFGDAQVRILAGCAPCQPFSSYSQRYETIGTERWGLLHQFARLVREAKPDMVTMENVPTVTRHLVFDDFISTLKEQGYKVWFKVIDCAAYGLPQRRRRTVLLASRFGNIELKAPSNSKQRTVADVLRGLPVLRHGGSNRDDPLHAASGLSHLNYERIKASKPGGTWRDWPKHLVAKCHKKKTGKTYSGVYGRMKWNEPAPTLTTQFFGFGNGRFGHPSQARGLSLREGAILQGFPENYSFVPKGGVIQFKVLGRLIGNAVPVDLGRVIGESIIEHVKQHVDQPSSPTNPRRGRNVDARPGNSVHA